MPRFLLDENVRIELAEFLVSRGMDSLSLPKGASDRALASVSKREKRVLVTNDSDFSVCAPTQVFGVVWLRIPQNDSVLLLDQFEKLLTQCTLYARQLITLAPDDWKTEPLPRKIH